LFRYIQAKVAKIENIAYRAEKFKELRRLTYGHNPTRIGKYIKNGHLSLDYILPDQFIPLY
jgi:hypothetical protein